MQKGQIGINGVHRRWASFSVGQEVTVEPYDIHSEGMDIYLGNLKLDIDFFQRSSRYPDEFKEEELDKAFSVVSIMTYSKKNKLMFCIFVRTSIIKSLPRDSSLYSNIVVLNSE